MGNIVGTIQTIVRNKQSYKSFPEERVKQTIVLPILQELDWEIFNPEEVVAEYNLGKSRVDYSLNINTQPKVFIEVKNANQDLESHQAQLLRYAFESGIKLAILTNGFTWWIYLPLTEGTKFEERRFLSIDLDAQEIESIINSFKDFLLKENIKNGSAIINAEKLHSDRRSKERISEFLPQIWQEILNGPHDLLVEILIEETERKKGQRPSDEQVKQFLRNVLIPNDSISIINIQPKKDVDNVAIQPQGKKFQLYFEGITADGYFSGKGKGFTVLKGSTIREKVTSHFLNTTNHSLREKLIRNGKIQSNKFTENYTFNSPSQAASVILGRSTNGYLAFNINDKK